MSPAPKVLLITMPWQSADNPSIQLGILKSCLTRDNIDVDCLYANLVFADMIGFDSYANLAGSLWYPFVREWLFNCFASHDERMDEDTLITLMDVFANNPITKHARIKDRHGTVLDPRTIIKEPLTLNGTELSHVDYFREIKTSVIPQFYQTLFSQVCFNDYSLVGFSCAFSQLVPSLSFAKKTKKVCPRCRIAFGGSAVQGGVGADILRFFPYVDYVCEGDGEEDIISMARGSFTNGSPKNCDINASPLPDYEDYFIQVAQIQARRHDRIAIHDGSIPYESSRGCLWAMRKPCAFCALNGDHLDFKSKTPEKILHDLESLSKAYSPSQITLTDNLVNVRHHKGLFQSLAAKQLDTTFFLEVKPTLTKSELALIRAAGVTEIQTGIEALSTQLQTLLGKGTTLPRTLQFLEDCIEVGITVHYNCLVGIPGESENDYTPILDLIPSIMHLPPPSIPLTPISLQKHSPYWKNPDRYGIRNIRPAKQYDLIFPPSVIRALAFIFDFDLDLLNDFTPDYVDSLVDSVLTWKRDYDQNSLSAPENGGYETEVLNLHQKS